MSVSPPQHERIRCWCGDDFFATVVAGVHLDPKHARTQLAQRLQIGQVRVATGTPTT
jgi:hypothetical protein